LPPGTPLDTWKYWLAGEGSATMSGGRLVPRTSMLFPGVPVDMGVNSGANDEGNAGYEVDPTLRGERLPMVWVEPNMALKLIMPPAAAEAAAEFVVVPEVAAPAPCAPLVALDEAGAVAPGPLRGRVAVTPVADEEEDEDDAPTAPPSTTLKLPMDSKGGWGDCCGCCCVARPCAAAACACASNCAASSRIAWCTWSAARCPAS